MYEKGPVRVVEMFTAWCVRNTNGVVAQCPLTGLENSKEVAAANARRIAACWNACEEAGLSTAALEAGVVREMVDEIKRLQQKVQRANALAVAAEQVLKAWSMGDYLTPFMDDLRNALLDFEGLVASEGGWLEIAIDDEEGGASDV